jgi:predicted nucleic acid-binding protein
MKVLVDTSVWSLALRKQPKTEQDQKVVDTLLNLIGDFRVVMIGQVRQELLSGISSESSFIALREKLRAFDDLHVTSDVYELAAEFYNRCRQKGVQGSHVDFFICAAAVRNNLPIFTLDKDFINYSKYIEIKLFESEG